MGFLPLGWKMIYSLGEKGWKTYKNLGEKAGILIFFLAGHPVIFLIKALPRSVDSLHSQHGLYKQYFKIVSLGVLFS